jgi:enoyl-CoA hydratase/carnithine racemase
MGKCVNFRPLGRSQFHTLRESESATTEFLVASSSDTTELVVRAVSVQHREMSSNDPLNTVLKDVASGVATLTFNRPESANGWNGHLQRRYFDLLAECDADPAVHAVVVTGAGKTWCPGADMNMLATAANAGQLEAPAQGSAGSERAASSANLSEGRPGYYPATIGTLTIGAINGACAGVGLVQALMLDLRFAAKGAKFTFAFARRGLIAEYGSAWLLPQIVGRSTAIDLLTSSRVIVAEEALELGLVDRVVDRDQLLDECRAYAHDVAMHCSPTSVSVMKRQINAAYGQTLPEATVEADRLMNMTIARSDFREGVKSFIEKRTPSFGPADHSLGLD